MEIIKDILLLYGPLSIGWIVAGILWYKESGKSDDVEQIADDYHAAIIENTRVIERLTTLLDERTRKSGR